jgi:GNAT superfamily N-acetyltransferase
VGGWSPDGMETDLAWLRYLFVHPRAFRCGVGRRLLGTIEPSATRSGRSRLQVWSSLNAVPSYQANGYHRERIGRIPVQTGVELDYVLLSKRP